MIELNPCPQCSRHVRGDTCPFCDAHVSSSPTRLRPAPRGRLARAALAAFGAAAVTVGAAGCGGHSNAVPPYGGPPDDGNPAPLPNDPAVDEEQQDGEEPEAEPEVEEALPEAESEPDVSPAPAYGAPPPQS